MEKDFGKWNQLKKSLDQNNLKTYFYEKEIWWCSIGLNIGFEEDGKNKNFERPVLVLKKFNKNILWVLPLTGKVKSNKYYYKVFFKGKYSSVILSQVKTISSKRLLRKIAKIKQKDFQKIKKSMKDLL